MGAFVDIEIYADRYEDIEALFAELNEEDETEETNLPPIIIYTPPSDDDYKGAA